MSDLINQNPDREIESDSSLDTEEDEVWEYVTEKCLDYPKIVKSTIKEVSRVGLTDVERAQEISLRVHERKGIKYDSEDNMEVVRNYDSYLKDLAEKNSFPGPRGSDDTSPETEEDYIVSKETEANNLKENE